MKFVTRLCAVVVLSVGLIAGCNKPGGGGSKGGGNGPGPVPPAPTVSIDFSEFPLMRVDSDKSVDQTLTIKNTGTEAVFLGANFNPAVVDPIIGQDSNHCLGSRMEIGATCDIKFTFRPQKTYSGVQQQSVQLTYGDSSSSLSHSQELSISYTTDQIQPGTELRLFFSDIKADQTQATATITANVDSFTSDSKNDLIEKSPRHGSALGFILYNTDSNAIKFPTCRPEDVNQCLNSVYFTGDKGQNVSKNLFINYRSCADLIKDLNKGLPKQSICGFEVVYMPTHDEADSSKNAILHVLYQTSDGIQKEVTKNISYQAISLNYNMSDAYNTAVEGLFTQNKKLAIFNNCKYNAWVENKEVPTGRITRTSVKIPKGTSIYYDDVVPNIFHGDIKSGVPSLNFYAKFGCDDSGYNCKIGEVKSYPNHPMGPPELVCGQNSDLGLGLACQADIGTKFEATFGCSLDPKQCSTDNSGDCPCYGDPKKVCPNTGCAKNPSDTTKYLTPSTFFDGSFVDGFSYNIAVDVFRATNETNPGCFSNKESQLSAPLDLKQNGDCPRAENMDPTPHSNDVAKSRWSLFAEDKHWNWDNTTPPLGWSSDEIGIINQIGYDNWTNGIRKLKKDITDLENSKPTFPICNDTNNHLNDCGSGTANVFPETPEHFGCFAAWYHVPTGSGADISYPVNCQADPNGNLIKFPNPRDPNVFFDLTQVDLSMSPTNRDTNQPSVDNSIYKPKAPDYKPVQLNRRIGCASPKSILSGAYQWGGYDLGGGCSYVGGMYYDNSPKCPTPAYARYYDRPQTILDPAQWTPNPNDPKNPSVYAMDYNNMRLMFANPFSNDNLIDYNPATGLKATPSISVATIYKTFVDFCKSQDKNSFCKDSSGNARSGLANIFGNMGPIRMSQYVTNLKTKVQGDMKGGPNYSWQYDDFDATRVCDSGNTKIMVIFCGKSQASVNAFPLENTDDGSTVVCPVGYNRQPDGTCTQ